MESQGQADPGMNVNKDCTLEINLYHPVLIKLNALRKKDSKKASLYAK